MFKKNARIASQKDLAHWRKNKESLKAQGIRLVREQGNWILINLKSFVTEAFWKAWRKDKEGLKAKGYHVARVYDHWIVY